MEVIAEDGQNLDEEEEEEEQKPEPPGAGRTWAAAGKVLWREKLRSGNYFPDGGELEKTGAEEEEVKHLLVLVLLDQNQQNQLVKV